MNDQYLLILFYSASGSVKNLAHAIADGAEASGMPTKIRTVPRVSPNSKATEPEEPVEGEIYCTKEELQHCAGLAIGSPTRFGSMAAPMKHFLDSTGDLWAANALENKPGMAFTSTSSMHGGQEITLWNILTYMLHQGMMIVGAPYSIDALHQTKSGGTPYGASHVNTAGPVLTDDERAIAEAAGKRLAHTIKQVT